MRLPEWLISLNVALLACGTATAAGTAWEDDDTYEVWELVYPDGGSDKAPMVEMDTSEMSILGKNHVDAHTMWRFVRDRNEDFPLEIAEAYIEIGTKYGIRGDVALCQAIVETGWFKFADGTAVTPDQHNYCGLGVTKRGLKGHSFDSIEEGVTAQLQHLYAYATSAPLPRGERMVDPRFRLVSRGCAGTWHELSNKWAMNGNYGKQIMDVYARMVEAMPK